MTIKKNKPHVVSFRLDKDTYNKIAERAIGSESVNELCRQMIVPNRIIQPKDLGHEKVKLGILAYYQSGFNQNNKALNMLAKNGGSNKRLLANIAETISTLELTIQHAFAIEIYERQKGEVKDDY